MMKKLTLSVDPKIAAAAHQLARSRGRSVSRMFSDFIAGEKGVQGASARAKSWLDQLGGKYGNAVLTDKKSLRRAMVERHG